MSSSSAPKTENKKGDFFARPWEPPSRGAPMGQSPRQVTTILTQGDRERTIDAGCDDYVSKPVDPEEVLGKIGEWLEG